ncbi:DUF2924 domain-containing protein [Aestuariibius insulae]|uniref:DUF2924 domain-containing protein n=1 Tax=Aestuariibius insulae TaxID=2058287 RepID=UPI00345EC0E8
MTQQCAERLKADLSELAQAPRADCLARWGVAFGRPPPKHLSLPFLRKVLIWERQTKALGGLSTQTEQQLTRLGRSKAGANLIKPGSHLVREWNGRTYQVEVTADGYLMDGQRWRSLSALARHITGAHWSGPRFFGLV